MPLTCSYSIHAQLTLRSSPQLGAVADPNLLPPAPPSAPRREQADLLSANCRHPVRLAPTPPGELGATREHHPSQSFLPPATL